MAALNIRDVVSEPVRQFIDRARADCARAAWIAEAREGLAFEAEHLERHGALLERYRTVRPVE